MDGCQDGAETHLIILNVLQCYVRVQPQHTLISTCSILDTHWTQWRVWTNWHLLHLLSSYTAAFRPSCNLTYLSLGAEHVYFFIQLFSGKTGFSIQINNQEIRWLSILHYYPAYITYYNASNVHRVSHVYSSQFYFYNFINLQLCLSRASSWSARGSSLTGPFSRIYSLNVRRVKQDHTAGDCDSHHVEGGQHTPILV